MKIYNEKIIKSPTPESMILARDAILEKLKTIKRLEKEMAILAKLSGISYLSAEKLSDKVHTPYDPECENMNIDNFDYSEAVKEIDQRFWTALVDQTNLETVMLGDKKSELDQKIHSTPPEFCKRELDSFFNNISKLYVENVIATVRETYKRLIGCYYSGGDWNNKKHDNLQGVKSAFRIAGNIRRGYRGWSLNGPGRYFNYQDFYTACLILDGKSRVDLADRYSVIFQSQEKNEIIACRYFTVKPYHNGNQYVKWTPEGEKVRKLLNQYGPDGAVLPDTMSKRYKPEHCQARQK